MSYISYPEIELNDTLESPTCETPIPIIINHSGVDPMSKSAISELRRRIIIIDIVNDWCGINCGCDGPVIF